MGYTDRMQFARKPLVFALVASAAIACGDSPTAAQSASPPPASASAPIAGSDQVVAEIGDRKITLAEVDAKWQEFDAAERARLTQLLYQNRRNMLDLVMGDVLIGEAAKAARLDVEAYTEREIARRLQPVTEAEIQRFFEENKERAQGRTLDQLRQPIQEFLQSQRQQQARAKLVDELMTRAGDVRVLLDPPRVEVTLTATDPSRGPANAPVTIIEYSDYQCPFCARVGPTLKKVLAEYGDKVRFVYKDFPLPTHPNAQKAAEAARCAGDQGKYWEMHDLMFADIGALSVPELKQGAAKLGLDQAAFDQCLDSNKHQAVVQADYEQAEKLGVNSTPTLYINGRPLIGAQPYEAFKQVIDEELARVGQKK